MKIRLEEYVGASRVRLSVDDAPMTALSRLVETFVTALDEVSEKQKAVVLGVDHGQPGGDVTAAFQAAINAVTGVYVMDAFTGELVGPAPTVEQPEELPKKRGRPRKVETAPEPVATEAQEEPRLPFTSPEPAPLSAGTQETATHEPTITQEPAAADTPPTSDDANAEPLAEITDSEMNRYCGKLAQHWGGAEKVYALAQKFVAEGELPRPTRIAGTEARWAFIREAETATGVKYHG